ncbi:MAG TPA: energy transducer TonB [Edaphobacter sp.]|nr:energy transducer TonB [Edaphobacter sp.]
MLSSRGSYEGTFGPRMRHCTFLLLLILSAALYAQNVGGVAMSAIPGMPFTGEETIVWAHQLNDKAVTTRCTGTVARDSQGRTYRETHCFTVDPGDSRTTPLRITLHDPGAGVITECDLSTKSCRIIPFPAAKVAKTTPVTEQSVKEDLGSRVIDGLTATGTRITQTSILNAPGPSQTTDKNNDSSIVEFWRSADLKVDLSELRKYPHGEIQDVHLAITSHAEPDPKIFIIPAGFTVRDDRALRRIGGDVSAPVLIYSVAPEFAQQARNANIAGNVLVNLVVDQNGNPTNVRVVRGIGQGLDEKAVESVRKYRFKPAMEHGQPVPVELNVEVNFQTF